MTYAEWTIEATGDFHQRAAAEHAAGIVIHVGAHGYIRRAGRMAGRTIYRIVREAGASVMERGLALGLRNAMAEVQ